MEGTAEGCSSEQALDCTGGRANFLEIEYSSMEGANRSTRTNVHIHLSSSNDFLPQGMHIVCVQLPFRIKLSAPPTADI